MKIKINNTFECTLSATFCQVINYTTPMLLFGCEIGAEKELQNQLPGMLFSASKIVSDGVLVDITKSEMKTFEII